MGETSIGLAIALLTRQDENLVHLRKANKNTKKPIPTVHLVGIDFKHINIIIFLNQAFQ